MLRERIKKNIAGVFQDMGVGISEIHLEHPENPNFGDFSTNISLQYAKSLKKDPRQLAEEIAQRLHDLSLYVFEKVEVAGPGFINFFIKKEVLNEELREIIKKGRRYGTYSVGEGKKARVEFISANPTGPLHFGNGRGGPIGDTIASLLEFAGYHVLREYLNNDCGNQIRELGMALAREAGLVTDRGADVTYQGAYTTNLAHKIKSRVKARGLSREEIAKKLGTIGTRLLFKEILDDSARIGITFDTVVHESRLQRRIPSILAELRKKKLLKTYEGAVWFAPRNEFLKDKDAVVVKRDGSYTYFASDIVYHKEKFESGYDLVVDVFGSNTLGHVYKLKALAEVWGFDPAKFKVILYQFVRIKRGSTAVRMSKRKGDFITVREVINEVGKDAFRFFILMHEANTHMDFDLELAKERSDKNPVYYVQYAHARICSILRKASMRMARIRNADVGLLMHPSEEALIRELIKFPEIVEDTAGDLQLQRLPHYAIKLADLFHRFYHDCLVLSKDKGLTNARLMLVTATKTVVKNTLDLMGVSAPQKM